MQPLKPRRFDTCAKSQYNNIQNSRQFNYIALDTICKVVILPFVVEPLLFISDI